MRGTIAVFAMPLLLAVSVSAAAYSGGGDGSPESPYRIATAEDLNDIGNHVEDFNKCFVLVNDINLADYTGTQFNVIGDHANPFAGVFDGNGFSLFRFSYCTSAPSEYTDYVGLFAFVDGVTTEIKNLRLVAPDVNDPYLDLVPVSDYGVGSLVGTLGNGTIYSCCAEGGRVSGQFAFYLGGLVGCNLSGTVRDCCSSIGVIGGRQVCAGGLVGYNSGTISNCEASGRISAHSAGGLVGWNNGDVRDSYAAGTVTGDYSVGGVVGENGESGEIIGCYATGRVSGTEHVGGLAGTNFEALLVNSYAMGPADGDESVGGAVGFNYEGAIVNCFAATRVSGDANVGGFVGYSKDQWGGCYYAKCFWDETANPDVNGIGNTTDPNVIGKSTTEMQTESTFTDAGWDFIGETVNGPNDIWDICEGTNYPRLVWQIPVADFVCPDGVNFMDFAFFAEWWGAASCCSCNNCEGTNLDFLNGVDWRDFRIFCQEWLEGTQ